MHLYTDTIGLIIMKIKNKSIHQKNYSSWDFILYKCSHGGSKDYKFGVYDDRLILNTIEQ